MTPLPDSITALVEGEEYDIPSLIPALGMDCTVLVDAVTEKDVGVIVHLAGVYCGEGLISKTSKGWEVEWDQ